MTDILLIQPPIRDFYLTAKRTQPYGLACIASALKAEGFTVEILDALATDKSRRVALPDEMSYLQTYYPHADRSPFALFHAYRHYGHSFAHIGQMARKNRPFLVGISALFTPYIQEALTTAEMVKSAYPDGRIVLGGHHPTAMPAEVMACPAVDFVIRGEGETALPLLARTLQAGGDLTAIPGLVFRRPDKSLHISPPAQMQNLDRFPPPALELLKHRYYRRHKRGSALIVASRGCPLRCSYCAVGAHSPIKYRRRSVKAVLTEIETAVIRHQAGFIDFEDENLTLERGWFLELMCALRVRFGPAQLELRAMNGLFPPSLDEEMIDAMQAAGFKTLNLSLCSTSTPLLRRFRRPDVREAFDRVVHISQARGLAQVGYIIAGGPDQTAETSLADLLFLAQRPVLAGVSLFYPAPGSPDFDHCRKLGILPAHNSLLRSSALPLAHSTRRLESVTLLRLGRILNFMKALIDRDGQLPSPRPLTGQHLPEPIDRMQAGKLLLQGFLHDGRIRGVMEGGRVCEHACATDLVTDFLTGLNRITLKGCA